MENAAARVTRLPIGNWPQKNRLALLRDLYTDALLDCDIAPIDGELTEFSVSARHLPGLDIVSVASSALCIRRSKAQVAPEHLYLNINLAGTRRVSQAGRCAILGEGEAMFIAGDSAVAMKIAPGLRYTLKMSAKTIETLVPDFGGRLVRPVPRDTDALRLLIGYLGTLDNTGDPIRSDAQRLFATHIYDLAALALGAVGDVLDMAHARGARAARLKVIKADVSANLDGDVSITAVARRHRVTPRSIQAAFEADGTTLTDFVLAQRLARAHRMLSDPLRADQKISTVAFDAGFGDLSYFNRVFRRRFGSIPSEVRETARQEPAESAAPAGAPMAA